MKRTLATKPRTPGSFGPAYQNRIRFLVLVIGFLLCFSPAFAQRTLIATGSYGAISAGHPLAVRAGLKMLERGGNAVDAAIAAAFVLGVVDFSNSGLGGDGHALIRTSSGAIEAWDGASPRPENPGIGICPAGLPTEVPLLLELYRRHATLSLAEIMTPAIQYARKGFHVSAYLEQVISRRLPTLKQEAAFQLLLPNGHPVRTGDKLQQPALGETLMNIAQDEGRSFSSGPLADQIILDLKEFGAAYEKADLAGFKPRLEAPVSFSHGPWVFLGVPPPSSSVVVFAIVRDLIGNSANPLRNEFISVFLSVLKTNLLLKNQFLSQCISNPRKFLSLGDTTEKRSPDLIPAPPPEPSLEDAFPGETTHLVTWDKNGCIVSMTLTLGKHFGSGCFSRLGFFYNSQMSNFLTGTRYQASYPQESGSVTAKSPIIVMNNRSPVFALGGAGENRIIANLASIIAGLVLGGKTLPEAVHAPRMFVDHTDKVSLEWRPEGYPVKELEKAFGTVKVEPPGTDFFGLISAIGKTDDTLLAVGDYRRDGSAGALTKSPGTPRTFSIEYILWGKKGLKDLSLATPLDNPRQKVGPLKTLKPPSFQEVPEGPNRRLTGRFPAGTSAEWFSQEVTIFPDRYPSPPPEYENPELWSKPNPLGPLEKAFLQKIPGDLSGKALVNWLLVEIGPRIPYTRILFKTSGEKLLQMKKGDCSGKARLMEDMLRAKGLPCRLVGGIILGEGLKEVTHIWNEVYLDGQWIHVCAVNYLFGRLPSNWLIMRYGDTTTLKSKGNILFKIRERKGQKIHETIH